MTGTGDRGAPLTVLVVDDHQMLAEALVRVLGAEDDLEVVGVAPTAAEAVAAARTHRPDVVVMDYHLPDGDGAQTTERIKAERPETRVVMLTGSGDDERILVAAIEAGCSGYVTKTKAVEELVSAVRAAAAGEVLIEPALLGRLLSRLHHSHRGLGSDLTPRELEVLTLMAEGLPNSTIAERLGVSLHTVRNHVQNVLTKLQAHSKLEAVATAVREGILRYG